MLTLIACAERVKSPLGYSRQGGSGTEFGDVSYPPIAIEFCGVAKFRDVPIPIPAPHDGNAVTPCDE
jgi:hypothetical protein